MLVNHPNMDAGTDRPHRPLPLALPLLAAEPAATIAILGAEIALPAASVLVSAFADLIEFFLELALQATAAVTVRGALLPLVPASCQRIRRRANARQP